MARYSSSSSSSYGLYGGPAAQPITDRFVPIPFDDIAAAATIKQNRYDQSVDGMNKLVGGIENIIAGSSADEKAKQARLGELNTLIDEKYNMGVDLADPFVMNQFNKDVSKFRSDPQLKAMEYNSQASSALRTKLAEAERVHGKNNKHRYRDLIEMNKIYTEKGTSGLLEETGSMYLPAEFNIPVPKDRMKDIMGYFAQLSPESFNTEELSKNGLYVIKEGQEKLAARRMLALAGIDSSMIGENLDSWLLSGGLNLNAINRDRASAFLSSPAGSDILTQAHDEYNFEGNSQHGVSAEQLQFLYTPEEYAEYKAISELASIAYSMEYGRTINSSLLSPMALKMAGKEAQGEGFVEEEGVGSYDIKAPRELSAEKLATAYGGEAADYGWPMRAIASRMKQPEEYKSKKEYLEAFNAESIKLSNLFGSAAAASVTKSLITGNPINIPGLAAETIIISTGAHLTAKDIMSDGLKKMADAMWELSNAMAPANKDLEQMISKLKIDNPNWDKMSVMEKREAFLKEEESYWNQFFKAGIIRDTYRNMSAKGAKEAQQKLAQDVFDNMNGQLQYKAQGDGDIKGRLLVGQGMITADDQEIAATKAIKYGDIVTYEGRTDDMFIHGPGYHAIRVTPQNESRKRKSEIYFVRGTATHVKERALGWNLMEPYRTPTRKMREPLIVTIGDDTYEIITYRNYKSPVEVPGEFTLEYAKYDKKTKKVIGDKRVLRDASDAPNGLTMLSNDLRK